MAIHSLSNTSIPLLANIHMLQLPKKNTSSEAASLVLRLDPALDPLADSHMARSWRPDTPLQQTSNKLDISVSHILVGTGATPFRRHHKGNVQIMSLQMFTSFYCLTSNQRLYSHDIAHSMTLSMMHFRDAARLAGFRDTFSLTLSRCWFPWRIPWRPWFPRQRSPWHTPLIVCDISCGALSCQRMLAFLLNSANALKHQQ